MELFAIEIYRCSGCGLCQRLCPEEAIKKFGGVLQIDSELCTRCGLCKAACPLGSIICNIDIEVPN